MYFGNYELSHYEPYLKAQKSEKIAPFLLPFLETKKVEKTKLHVAAIVSRGKVIASATNQIASRTCGASHRGCQNYIHAERNVVSKIAKHLLRGASLYVMRIKSGEKGNYFQYSQPCPECTILLQKCMSKYGLKNVYFTV